MALSYTPTTELQAVNMMLGTIGEQPVTSVADTPVSEASIAYNILHAVNRDVQAIGLKCNTEENYTIALSIGTAPLPAATLKVSAYNNSDDYTMRGTYLYDRKNHTTAFTLAPVVDIVLFQAFTNLPQSVRHYITVKAARIFQSQVVGSDILDKLTDAEEKEAFQYVCIEEILPCTIQKVSKEVQLKGFNFNTETDYPLTRDINGYLQLPTGTLKIDGVYPSDDVVIRGAKLYDKINHTFVFTKDLKVDITVLLAYSDLPMAVRNYIEIRASRRLQAYHGLERLYKMTEADERAAWLIVLNEELESNDATIFDAYDTYKTVSRRY